MKRVKISLLIVFASTIILTIFQNQTFFMNNQSLTIDIYFTQYETPLMSILSMFFICFVVGFVLSFLYIFSMKLKSSKIIKELRSREATLSNLVKTLQDKLKSSTIDNDKELNDTKII